MSHNTTRAGREVFFARRQAGSSSSWRGVGHQDCEMRLRVERRGGEGGRKGRRKEGRAQSGIYLFSPSTSATIRCLCAGITHSVGQIMFEKSCYSSKSSENGQEVRLLFQDTSISFQTVLNI